MAKNRDKSKNAADGKIVYGVVLDKSTLAGMSEAEKKNLIRAAFNAREAEVINELTK